MNNAVLQKLRRFGNDSMWIDRHYEQLRAKCPNEWVAVLDGVVIVHDKTIEALMQVLEEMYPEDAGDIAVEYISKEKVELVL